MHVRCRERPRAQSPRVRLAGARHQPLNDADDAFGKVARIVDHDDRDLFMTVSLDKLGEQFRHELPAAVCPQVKGAA